MKIKQIMSPIHGFSISRLLTSLIWFAILGIFTSNAYGAAKTYSFSVTEIPFEAAVIFIEEKTDYSFVYKTELIKKGTLVSFEVKNEGIERVVKKLIKGLPLTYEIKNRRIFLSDKRNYKAKSTEKGKRLVSGRVLDENGEPLVGATISIPEAKIYAVTDADGNYAVSIPNELKKSKLQISYVGFNPKSISLKDQTELNITMQSNSQVLSDLVVVGYGTQKRESLTSAISTVSSEDISRSAATNTSGALVGKVAGINSRMSDGRPGSYTAINIRNMGTPLYVVDGVQMDEGQFNNIDFNDIESISVLKDASAAIYGVRAANGVVVVTTKSGKRNQKNTININAYYGWQEMMRFPKPSDAITYVESQIQSSTVRGFDSKYSREDLEKWRKGTEKGYQGFDWYDYIFNSAPQWYTSANISGGSDKINYYIAMSHLRQDAIIVNYGNFHRTNIQFNLDADITDKFKIGTSINGRLQEEIHPGVPQSDDFLTAIWATTNLPTVRPFANDNPKYPALVNQAGYTNFAILNFEQSGTNRDRWKVMQFNLTAEYELIQNLKLKGLFSYFYANRRWDNQENSYKLYAYNEKTDTYNVVMNSEARYKQRDIQNNENINTQISATYKTTIADRHNIDAFVGAETYKMSTPGFDIYSNPTSNALTLFYMKDMSTFNDRGDNTQTRAGFMGKVNYDFDSRYLLELQARYDGSWKVPPKHRWGFFPSVSAGWRLMQEKFWSDEVKDVLSNLKLRFSYGVLGDDNVSGYGAFDYLDGYNYNSGGAVIDGEYVIGARSRALAVTNIS